jgi:PST family polysaccharide transporter
VIGLFHDENVVGLYFWGFALSMQTMFLLATGLKDVLFPTLSKLNDQPQRQAVGFRNALRLMMLVAAPAAVLQAVTADPLVKLLFEQRWEPAIPVVQYLSFAMLSQPMQVMAMSLIMALGRFRLMTLVGFVQAVLLVGGSVVGAKLGAEREIAIWSGAGLLLGGLYAGYVGFVQLGDGLKGLIDSFWRTIVPSVASGLLAWGAALWVRRYGSVAEIAAAGVVLVVVYVPLACLFARADVAQLLVRLRMNRLAGWLGPRDATEH